MILGEFLEVSNLIPLSKQTMLKNNVLKTQDNTIYTFSINISFSSIGQDKVKLQKQRSKLLQL